MIRFMNACKIFGLFLFMVLFNSCGLFESKKDKDEGFPETPQEIQGHIENNQRIAVESQEIIDQGITEMLAAGEYVDVREIAKNIQKIEGIVSANPTRSGSGIVIKSKNGTFTNALIARRDDDRLFEETAEAAYKPINFDEVQFMAVRKETHGVSGNYPNGDGKALILAPFQQSLEERVSLLASLLRAAGFEVDIFFDEEANLDRFRASFMAQYDIVYIATHGAADFMTQGGVISTVLLTGERQENAAGQQLTLEERIALAIGVHDGTAWYAISVPWLEETIDEAFPNSWIFANSCESLLNRSGAGSLAQAFFSHGAGGYSGFVEIINNSVAKNAGEKLTALLTSGQSLEDASENTRNDFGLRTKAWLIRLFTGSASAKVSHLGNMQRINDPFYLFDPDQIVGEARTIPSYGPPGTDLVYEVNIRNFFAEAVTHVEFDIDNTDENITMQQVDANLWRRSNLRAPISSAYPRVDTFTFSAFNNNGELLGQGSATFTIHEPDQTGKLNITHDKYFSRQH